MPSVAALVSRVNEFIINPLIVLLFAVATVVFLWGVSQFLFESAMKGEQEDGKRHMLWGVIGMAIMISVYGILSLLDNTFQLGALNGNIDTSRINNITAPINFGGQP